MSIFNHFQQISLTEDQKGALDAIENFLSNENEIFILKGYAGSGKTTIIKGIVEFLDEQEKKYLLLSPTGRAAKVLRQKTLKEAYTIHKGIFSFEVFEELKNENDEESDSFCYYYKLRNNTNLNNIVIIIDEASMLSNNLSQGEFFRFGSGKLLNDLIEFSRIRTYTANTKIIFVGDPAQLPPIGMNSSPALDSEYLKENYNVKVDEIEIKEVKRQNDKSGILETAGKLRKSLTSGYYNDFNLKENNIDIFQPSFQDFSEIYKSTKEPKIIIVYQNKTALDLNLQIRQERYGSNLHIQQGDHIIIGGNNYKIGIMNGEFGVVLNSENQTIERSITFNKKGGQKATVLLVWRYVELLFSDDNNGEKIVKGYMLENFLNGDNVITPDEQQALYVDFKKRHPNLKPKTEEFKEAMMTDLFINAILLKYGYAVTCHKAQGGEWKNTFVFWDYRVKKEFDFYEEKQDKTSKTNSDFYRWAYTAITRASSNLYCINPPHFNSFSSISYIPKEVINSFHEVTGRNLGLEEIEVDTTIDQLLHKFRIDSYPLFIQDHFIITNHIVSKLLIDITTWRKNQFEIVYTFSRLNEIVSIKTWINGKDQFNNKYAINPHESNSNSLFKEIEQLLLNQSHFKIIRKKKEDILSKIEIDIDIEEKYPFLMNLFEEFTLLCNKYEISVINIEHNNYCERYTLSRNSEYAKIDIWYTEKGFFTYVNQLEKECNSEPLIKDIKSIIDKIKETESEDQIINIKNY